MVGYRQWDAQTQSYITVTSESDINSKLERKRDSDEAIDEWINKQSDINPDMVVLEPRSDFNSCIVGAVERINLNVLCYSEEAIILMLENTHGMSREEAEEHISFNVKGYFGENSPVFLNEIT